MQLIVGQRSYEVMWYDTDGQGIMGDRTRVIAIHLIGANGPRTLHYFPGAVHQQYLIAMGSAIWSSYRLLRQRTVPGLVIAGFMAYAGVEDFIERYLSRDVTEGYYDAHDLDHETCLITGSLTTANIA